MRQTERQNEQQREDTWNLNIKIKINSQSRWSKYIWKSKAKCSVIFINDCGFVIVYISVAVFRACHARNKFFHCFYTWTVVISEQTRARYKEKISDSTIIYIGRFFSITVLSYMFTFVHTCLAIFYLNIFSCMSAIFVIINCTKKTFVFLLENLIW